MEAQHLWYKRKTLLQHKHNNKKQKRWKRPAQSVNIRVPAMSSSTRYNRKLSLATARTVVTVSFLSELIGAGHGPTAHGIKDNAIVIQNNSRFQKRSLTVFSPQRDASALRDALLKYQNEMHIQKIKELEEKIKKLEQYQRNSIQELSTPNKVPIFPLR